MEFPQPGGGSLAFEICIAGAQAVVEIQAKGDMGQNIMLSVECICGFLWNIYNQTPARLESSLNVFK